MADDPSPQITGPNAWLVDEMYEQYVADPSSVSESWQDFFADYRPSASPRVGSAPAAPTLPHALDAAGAVIFIVGLLVYFSVIPFLYDGSLLATDVPSLVLYLLLDCVLVLNLAGAARSAWIIANYVDVEALPALRRDYAGGFMTYDGHNGIDMVIPDLESMATGVAVRVAQCGEVVAVEANEARGKMVVVLD